MTPEKEALISVYQEKWQKIAHSTQPIDRKKATIAVKSAYDAIAAEQPEIIFCSSPHAGILASTAVQEPHLPLAAQLIKQFDQVPSNYSPDNQGDRLSQILIASWAELNWLRSSLLAEQLWQELKDEIWRQWQQRLEKESSDKIKLVGERGNKSLQSARQFFEYFWMRTDFFAKGISGFDFCFSELNIAGDRRKWEALKALVSECGWICAFEKTAIVCDRPIKLSFDSENRLHGIGEPAIQFADGYKLYAYQGRLVPEKYGKFPPQEWRAEWYLQEQVSVFRHLLLNVLPPETWRSEWLLGENNTEVRWRLIQGIGYSRICTELQAEELDSWKEYGLLKIDKILNTEAIYLLKMTCPSTGKIHALRVPPEMRSAREAIRWVNWGIDPEEFSVES